METQNRNEALTVGELVAEDYRKADIFKKYGIDFCCGGNRSLKETCEKEGISVDAVSQELAAIDDIIDRPSQNYNNWELDFLVDYIVNTHHIYVHEAIPVLEAYSTKVARVHGSNHPEVIEIANLFQAISEELQMHMHKEEVMLFPAIKKMVKDKNNNQPISSSPFGSISNPINMMEQEHESAGGNLKAISELSNEFTPPEEACATYQVLFAKLQEFENDLHQHIHLENNILFPKAIKLEAEFS
ncbi:MAG: iron-sulfur cluster repair di-iron protein [Cytophagales bacterium]|nr:iron-sulfur cluster repair di-iron protein [Cytophagales bacterium]